MFQRIKHAFCRLLGIKTRPYLTPSPLPKGPIIEPLTPSTLIHRRKPEPVPSMRSDPVYDTWPDPFREQRPKRVDPRPRPLLRAVTRDDPPAPAPAPAQQGPTALEIIFADAVMRSVSSTPAPAPEPLPDFAPIFGNSPAPSYNSDYGCSRDYTPDAPSSSSDSSSSSSDSSSSQD